MRIKLSYANVAATLALVLSMSGGALAATHYLINSTRQINPKVLKKLHGARGIAGEIGAIGPEGPPGIQGKTGPRGEPGPLGPAGLSALSKVPAGQSESGDFDITATSATVGTTVSGVTSFAVPLSAAITKVEFATAQTGTAHCAGPGSAGTGYLCVYATKLEGLESPEAFDPESEELTAAQTGTYGFGLTWHVSSTGPVRAVGTYTVTAAS
jgi:hypothetical protein